jgi:copper chaperone
MRQELSLSGMSCGHCVMAVKQALQEVDAVEIESVEIGKAIISTPDFSAVEERIKSDLAEEGYPVESVRAL